ncbi:MAG: hypothetical protein ACK4L8_09445 [Nitrincola lacisaponensis]|uniref:hypothetical protein n=1 Tax=Nitrincola lacisaponensis TaxID=267850 RepID=UPI00391C9202
MMLIRVLPSLESREDWLSFFRREHPYCLVETPAVLVDFQSTFLQLTSFEHQGTTPIRYTLGARSSLEPAWQLIKGCGWRLSCVMEGLQSLDFNTNVRDNTPFKLPSDLSVRKSFAREPRLEPLLHRGNHTGLTPEALARRLRDGQYRDWQALSAPPLPSFHSTLLSLSTEPWRWQLEQQDNQVHLALDGRHIYRCDLTTKPPKQSLRSDMIKL